MHEEQPGRQDDILLVSHLVTILRHRKKMIFWGTLGVTLAALVISLLLPRVYRSEAVVSMGKRSIGTAKGIEIPVYNNYSSVLNDNRMKKKYLKFNAPDLYEERKAAEFKIESGVEPILGYSKEERVKSTANFVLGLRVFGEGDTPEKARQICRMMGNYARTAIINLRIDDIRSAMVTNQESILLQKRDAIIDVQYKLEELKEKEALITGELLKLAGGTSAPTPDVLNVSESTAKFLSPRRQLVALKVSQKDSQLRIKALHREIRISRMLLEFLKKIKSLMDEKQNFLVKEDLLETIIQKREQYFSDKDGEERQKAYNTFSIKFSALQRLSNIFDYITKPTLPTARIKPRRKLIVIFSFILSFGFFLCLAMALEWWRKYKNQYME